MFELGTHKSKLYRSSKNEWFGGTEGFYWGCNNTKDLDVRLETIASVERPAGQRRCSIRPTATANGWSLYDKYKGKIDADFGKLAFTTPPIAASHSVDAKFTTTDMAKELKTWALFGPPLGRTWQPTPGGARNRVPSIRPLVANDWTVLTAEPPQLPEKGAKPACDLDGTTSFDDAPNPEGDRPPAWHGTLLAGVGRRHLARRRPSPIMSESSRANMPTSRRRRTASSPGPSRSRLTSRRIATSRPAGWRRSSLATTSRWTGRSPS